MICLTNPCNRGSLRLVNGAPGQWFAVLRRLIVPFGPLSFSGLQNPSSLLKFSCLYPFFFSFLFFFFFYLILSVLLFYPWTCASLSMIPLQLQSHLLPMKLPRRKTHGKALSSKLVESAISSMSKSDKNEAHSRRRRNPSKCFSWDRARAVRSSQLHFGNKLIVAMQESPLHSKVRFGKGTLFMD